MYKRPNKFKVPSIQEVRDLEKQENFKVVSLFAGGGGSSTGYRMAGGKILAINEFVKEARDTYGSNYPSTHIFDEDIRELTGDMILKQIGMEKGELDILDGSPPCSAFSAQGSREKGWGKEKSYSTDKVQRVDDLFLEYARILKDVQPKVFVAENVKGLTAGNALEVLSFPKEFLNYVAGHKHEFGDIEHIEHILPEKIDEDMRRPSNEDISYYGKFFDSLNEVFIRTANGENDTKTQDMGMNFCKTLEEAGYTLAYRVMDGSEYGVPQKRERLIITGIRNDLAEEFKLIPSLPESTHLHPQDFETYEKYAIEDDFFDDEPNERFSKLGIRTHLKDSPNVWAEENDYEPVVTVKEAIEDLMDDFPDWTEPNTASRMQRINFKRPQWYKDLLHKEEDEFFSKLSGPQKKKFKRNENIDNDLLMYPVISKKELGHMSDIMTSESGSGLFLSTYDRASWDKPHYTFTTVMRPIHAKLQRTLSIEEGKLLMTFPQDYSLIGTPAQNWERIARAVAPFMMRAIGRHIHKNVLKKIKD